MSGGPIFICGLAHSGKTPLRLALDAHANIALSRRTYMWNRFYQRYGDLKDESNFERCLAAMLGYPAIRSLRADAGDIRREFQQGAATYERLFALFHERHAQRQGKSRWGDQLGSAARFADAIFAAYPNARMIHMIRDPRESYEEAMQHSRFRKGKVGWSTARWLHSAALTQRNQARYADAYKVLQYEKLMSEPEKTLREVCAFLGERFEPAVLDAMAAPDLETDGRSRGASIAAAGRASRSQAAGERRLSIREIAFTQTYTGSQLQAFGYPLEATPFSAVDRLLFYLVDWPANRAAMFTWRALQETAP